MKILQQQLKRALKVLDNELGQQDFCSQKVGKGLI